MPYLCSVKNRVQQLASWVLLLCMVATLLPLSALHHHEEHAHHDHNPVAEEAHCHAAPEHQECQPQSCEHNGHLTPAQESCALCSFLTTESNEYTTNSQANYVVASVAVVALASATTKPLRSASSSIRGRAPPSC